MVAEPGRTRPAARRVRLAPRPGGARRPRVVVVGDLVLDLVVTADRPLLRGSDVTGRVALRQGGSAASTARWIARAGARATLVCAVGRDGVGRALVGALERDGVVVRAVRVAGAPTGRIAVVVDAAGERSFVTDRGAALRLRPEDLRASWFAHADALHLPAYSLLDEPLGHAGAAALRLARAAGALVTLDLSSSGPLLARGRGAALDLVRAAAPDVLLATAAEVTALLGTRREAGLLDLAPAAVVKRGRTGATVLARDRATPIRLEVATTPLRVADTTGAGDAFDAGFLAGWLEARRRGLAAPEALRRGAAAGNRLAARHLAAPPAALAIG